MNSFDTRQQSTSPGLDCGRDERQAAFWLAQGQRCLTQGDSARALRCLQQALAHAPDRLEAWLGLAYALQAGGEARASIATYYEILRRWPDETAASLGLARVCKLTGELDAASGILSQLLARRPDCREALAAQAGLLERRGHHQEAYDLAAPALAGRARDPALVHAFARICLALGRPAEALPHVEAALAGPLQPLERGPLCFRLGELYDRLQQPDRAFAAFCAGNALKPQRFDLAAHRRLLEALQHSFTRARLQGLRPGVVASGPRPVFIVGMPRSGTSLAEQILSAHPRAFGAGERPWLRELWQRLVPELGPDWGAGLERLRPAQWQASAATYRDRLHALAPQAACISDKLPANFLQLGLIQLLFPDAVVIHCLRDPLDTCFSCFSHDFAQLDYTNDLELLGQYYLGYRELMAHWRRELDLPILELAYEELVADPETLSRRLISHVGLDWDPRCLEFYRSGRAVATASYDQVRRPIYASSVGRAQAYAPWLEGLQRLGIGRSEP